MENLAGDFEAMRVAIENVSSNPDEGAVEQKSGENNGNTPSTDTSSYTFVRTIGSVVVYYSIIKKKPYSFLWIGTVNGTLNNLAVSMPTHYDKGGPPPATQILGSADHTQSSALASKLAKRTNRAFYVSYNLPDMDARFIQEVDQKLFEEISVQSDKF